MAESSVVVTHKKGHAFFWRRLHSLAGVVPLGFFLLEHLWSNAAALSSPQSYNQQVHTLQSLPMLVVIEALFIWLPMLYHGIYGFVRISSSQPNVGTYSWGRNWLYTLQRISGVIVFIFVVVHFLQFRVLQAGNISFDTVSMGLSNPWIMAGYLLGVIATCYHFGNGIATFCITWGITIGPHSQHVMAIVGLVVFALLAIVGVLSVFAFTSGLRIF